MREGEREVLEEVVSDDSANWLPAAAVTYLGHSPYMTSARVKKYPFVFNVNLEISLNLGTNGIRILQKEGEGSKNSKTCGRHLWRAHCRAADRDKFGFCCGMRGMSGIAKHFLHYLSCLN